MLSIYRDSSGKTVVDVTNCESIREVKVVKMMNLGLTDFDQQMFSQMKDVEEMDISGNRLDTIPEYISLPKLKRLNCSRNRFSDITFVQQFPNLEEMDIRQNKVAFSDHCIACELCPMLKRVNNQEINIEKLKEKIENRLKPLISKVWVDHFMSTFDETMTMEEFEIIGEKFRTMLKHSNITVTKLVLKFKDFKLMQLIDKFLNTIRVSSSEDTLLSCVNSTAERPRRMYKAKRAPKAKQQSVDDIEFVPVTLPAPEADVPQEDPEGSEAAKDQERKDPTVYVLTGDSDTFEMDSDTVYILTDDTGQVDLSNVVILTENGTITENCEKAILRQEDKDEETAPENIGAADAKTAETEQNPAETTESPAPPEESDAKAGETRVTKFVPGPLSWEDPPKEQGAPNDPSLPKLRATVWTPPDTDSNATEPEPPEPRSKQKKPVAGDSERKVVKYWLYDGEIKPLRRTDKAKPAPTQSKRKRGNLKQYIVGPASQFSLVNRRGTNTPNDDAAPESGSSESPAETAEIVDSAQGEMEQETEQEVVLELSAEAVPGLSTEAVVLDLSTEAVVVDLSTEAVVVDLSVVAHADLNKEVVLDVSEEIVLDLSKQAPLDLSRPSDLEQHSGNNITRQEIATVVSADVAKSAPVENGPDAPTAEKSRRARRNRDSAAALRMPPKKRVRFLDQVQTEMETNCSAQPRNGVCQDTRSAQSLPDQRFDMEVAARSQESP